MFADARPRGKACGVRTDPLTIAKVGLVAGACTRLQAFAALLCWEHRISQPVPPPALPKTHSRLPRPRAEMWMPTPYCDAVPHLILLGRPRIRAGLRSRSVGEPRFCRLEQARDHG